MTIWLLDDTLRVNIFYERADSDLRDNICLSISESCPLEEKLFIADETNIFLTEKEAHQLAEALIVAVNLCNNRDAGTEENN